MKSNESMTFDEIAELLATITGDDCACNINGNDEWLSFVCKYCKDETLECPEPKEKYGCWKEFLRNLNKLYEYNELGLDEYMKKYLEE